MESDRHQRNRVGQVHEPGVADSKGLRQVFLLLIVFCVPTALSYSAHFCYLTLKTHQPLNRDDYSDVVASRMAVLVEVVEQQAGTTWHRLTTMMGLAHHSEMEAAPALVDCSQLSRKQRKTASELCSFVFCVEFLSYPP